MNMRNLVIAVTAGLAMGGMCKLISDETNSQRMVDKTTKELKEINNLSFTDYEKITKGISNFSTDAEKVYHLKNAIDSLNMKSAVEKAYFEGAQMVRDSIKTAAKTIK